MTLSTELRRNLRAALAEVLADGGGDVDQDPGHADRVWVNARTIALGERRDPSPALMAAAYLHELVSLPVDHPDRAQASFLSATAAGPVMEALGFGPRDIAIARHAIEAHSISAGTEPLLPEAMILRDADRLDSLGAVGIARCLAMSGSRKLPLFDVEDPFARGRAADDTVFAVDHFAARLRRLPRDMLTGTGRRLATERAEATRRWLADLARELHVPAPDW